MLDDRVDVGRRLLNEPSAPAARRSTLRRERCAGLLRVGVDGRLGVRQILVQPAGAFEQAVAAW
jgi:hypothetical protein